MSDLFARKVVLVTGGASGIGASAARRLALEGARVAIVDRNEAGAQRVAERIIQEGGQASVACADVADEADNQRMFEECERRFGLIDAVFLNAGVTQGARPTFDGLTVEMFDRVIAINLRGPFLGMREALRRMKPGGSVCVTASTAALSGLPGSPIYCASKHGVLGLVRSAAQDFAKAGLRINAICPGVVLTGMAGWPLSIDVEPAASLQMQDYEGALSPQSVAEMALWLLSPAAAGVTGHGHVIDAGVLASFSPTFARPPAQHAGSLSKAL